MLARHILSVAIHSSSSSRWPAVAVKFCGFHFQRAVSGVRAFVFPSKAEPGDEVREGREREITLPPLILPAESIILLLELVSVGEKVLGPPIKSNQSSIRTHR